MGKPTYFTIEDREQLAELNRKVDELLERLGYLQSSINHVAHSGHS